MVRGGAQGIRPAAVTCTVGTRATLAPRSSPVWGHRAPGEEGPLPRREGRATTPPTLDNVHPPPRSGQEHTDAPAAAAPTPARGPRTPRERRPRRARGSADGRPSRAQAARTEASGRGLPVHLVPLLPRAAATLASGLGRGLRRRRGRR